VTGKEKKRIRKKKSRRKKDQNDYRAVSSIIPGAILGKAMTRLEQGKDLVLALVSLQ
jgi:hypothetical protein